jgi:hypothetical protein
MRSNQAISALEDTGVLFVHSVRPFTAVNFVDGLYRDPMQNESLYEVQEKRLVVVSKEEPPCLGEFPLEEEANMLEMYPNYYLRLIVCLLP